MTIEDRKIGVRVFGNAHGMLPSAGGGKVVSLVWPDAVYVSDWNDNFIGIRWVDQLMVEGN
jgi:hypothetical protein